MKDDQERYCVGIIGCGRVAALHAEAYMQVSQTRLAAAADVDTSKLESFAARWSIPQRYSSFEEMLAHEDLDVVSVCTIDNLHGPATIAAAEAGVRGIFCEKPMAFHLAEADHMIKACDQSGAKLIIDHSMRFEANYRRVKEMIEEGVIGELRVLAGSILTSGSPDPQSWHSHYQFAGGGALMHNGTHLFDIVRFYAGDVAWVFARVERADRTVTIEDMAAGVFGLRKGCHFFFESGGRRRYGAFEIILQGSEGRLVITHGSRNRLETSWGNSWEPYIYLWRRGREPFDWECIPTEADNPWVNAVVDLLDCIERNRESISSGREGRAALEMIMAVYESQRRGGVRVDLPLTVQDNPLEAMLITGQI